MRSLKSHFDRPGKLNPVSPENPAKTLVNPLQKHVVIRMFFGNKKKNRTWCALIRACALITSNIEI